MAPANKAQPPPLVALPEAESGRAVHALVAGLLARGPRSPDPAAVLTSVARHPLVGGYTGPYRQAAKQQVLSAVSVYFRLFAPPPSWRFTGAEVPVGECRLDLVFENAAGRIRADEIKSGRAAAMGGASADGQVQRQVEAAATCFGERFEGVRAIVLTAPRLSFLLRADGARELIFEEG